MVAMTEVVAQADVAADAKKIIFRERGVAKSSLFLCFIVISLS